MRIQNLVLVTSLFAIACGKSDDKRLEELGELLRAVVRLVAQGLPARQPARPGLAGL